ncbi:MAG: SusC/RagA family TonB-linked outer membrane protein [Prevotella sp.]|nr:SusC/RagA family TonB-linked outer membrane protein [Prevotella sp.]
MKNLLNKKTVATLTLCLSMSATVLGQNQVIHLQQTKTSVSSIIKAIRKQTQMSVDFSQNTINLNKTVNLKSKSISLGEAMNQILSGNGDLSYKIVDRHIIILKGNNTQQIKKAPDRGAKFKMNGCVLDPNGDPIIGASVFEKGTKNGTVTDINGNYTLISNNESPTLEISYIGFITQQVKARNGVITNITMKENAQNLEELVVVGYGSQKKENLTGSVSSVSSKELESRPITSVKAGIQGLVPGLQVTNSQGRPGEDNTSMIVRGVGTLNNASPYILIDGVESGTMSAIDPNDVESISVLKDAASAAIYGSKAANGVILITTKRGKSGKPTVNYNGTVGWQAATGYVKRMHAADAAEYLNKALLASGKSARFLPEDIEKFRDGSDPYGHPDTDWQDLAYQGNGFMHQHSASVNGGNDNASYMLSAGYLNQNGIMKHSNREQFNLRSNVDVKLSNKFSVHTSLAYINNKYEDPTNSYVGGGSDQIIRQVNLFAPWVPYKNEDGTYGTLGDGNPIAWIDLDQTIKRRHQNFTGILSIDYQILKQLKFTAKGAYISQWESTDDFMKDIQYNPSKYHGPNSLNSRRYSWNRPSLDLLLNY